MLTYLISFPSPLALSWQLTITMFKFRTKIITITLIVILCFPIYTNIFNLVVHNVSAVVSFGLLQNLELNIYSHLLILLSMWLQLCQEWDQLPTKRVGGKIVVIIPCERHWRIRVYTQSILGNVNRISRLSIVMSNHLETLIKKNTKDLSS